MKGYIHSKYKIYIPYTKPSAPFGAQYASLHIPKFSNEPKQFCHFLEISGLHPRLLISQEISGRRFDLNKSMTTFLQPIGLCKIPIVAELQQRVAVAAGSVLAKQSAYH